MMTMDTNKEVYDILNNAIVEMKAEQFCTLHFI